MTKNGSQSSRRQMQSHEPFPGMSRERRNFSIREVSPEDTFGLRIAVLRPHTAGDVLRFPGDDAPSTVHLGAYLDGSLVGVTTAIQESPPDGADRKAYRLRGVAVAPEQQGSGIGRALLQESERRIRDADGALMWCNARVGVIPFYRKLGFEVVSEEFDIPRIGPHVRMRKNLSPTKS